MADTQANDDLLNEEVENQEQTDKGEDILKLDYIEYEAPKFYIGNYPIDQSTVMTFSVGIILWIILYFQLGLNKSDCKLIKPFFIISILFWLSQIHNRRNEKLAHISNESTSKHRARDSTIVILSIIALFTAFSWSRVQPQDQAILGCSLIGTSFWLLLVHTRRHPSPIQKRKKRTRHIHLLRYHPIHDIRRQRHDVPLLPK